jgi:hypothetical protein
MAKERKYELGKGEKPAAVYSWRKTDSPVKEVKRLKLEGEIKELGWSSAYVSRVMNTVTSEEAFRYRVWQALTQHRDELLYVRAGSPAARAESKIPSHHDPEARGYTRSRSLSLDEAPVLDPSTQEDFTDEARQRWEAEREDQIAKRKAKRRATELRELELQARRRGLEVDEIFGQIDKRIDALRALLKEAA